MKTTNDEVKDVRAALKKEGYEIVYCRHGNGTAYNWIEVCVIYPDILSPMVDEYGRYSSEYNEYYNNLHWLVKKSSGRQDLEDDIMTDLFMVNILVNVISREDHEKNKAWQKKQKDNLLKSKTCADCGVLGVYQKRKVRYNNVYKCPSCGKEWC